MKKATVTITVEGCKPLTREIQLHEGEDGKVVLSMLEVGEEEVRKWFP